MDLEKYRKRVELAFHGEVYGEELFATLAANCSDPELGHKMRVLERLEHETKERLRPLAAELGCSTVEDDTARARAKAEGAKLSAMARLDLMRFFKNDLPGYVAVFERMQSAGRPQDAPILAHVTAHERAILSFTERELAGQANASLEPIVALLHSVPSR
jgi:hypothetical protein